MDPLSSFSVFISLLTHLICLQPPSVLPPPLPPLPLFPSPSLSLTLFSLPHSPLVSLASLDLFILCHSLHHTWSHPPSSPPSHLVSSSLIPSITLGLLILRHHLHHTWPLSLLNLTWSPLACSGSLSFHSRCFPQPPLLPHLSLPSLSFQSASVHLDFLSLLTLTLQLNLFSFLFCL